MPNLNTEIIGQIFTPAGVRVGGEFQINADSTNLQLGHEVITLTDGRIAAIWQDVVLVIDPVTGQPTSTLGSVMEMRFLTAAGAVTGSDVTVVTAASGFQFSDEERRFLDPPACRRRFCHLMERGQFRHQSDQCDISSEVTALLW